MMTTHLSVGLIWQMYQDASVPSDEQCTHLTECRSCLAILAIATQSTSLSEFRKQVLAIFGSDPILTEEMVNLRPDQTDILLVDRMTIEQAQRQITSCESCNPAGAELLFSSILDELMGTDAQFTDYILEVRARCPHCGATVAENTVVACE